MHEIIRDISMEPTNPRADIPERHSTPQRDLQSGGLDVSASIRDLRLSLCLGYAIAAAHL
jgi:hypothetical protein